MSYPGAWQFALLALAALRVTRLVGWDDLTATLRDRLTRRPADPYALDIDHPYRPGFDKFLHCPYCVGWWVSLTITFFWLVEPRVTLAAATPFAISSIVGLVARNLDA